MNNLLNRVARKIKFLLLETRVRNFRQLKKIKPFDRIDDATLAANKIVLQPYFDEYVREVSVADMAASLELATFIYTACQANRYSKLLDTGSGLSSFVFRLYARGQPGVTVWSVDDDAAWLEKTRTFLTKHGLSVENVVELNDFLALKERDFDCILHDLNFVDVRIKYVDRILDLARPGGFVVFDDVHKPDYRLEVLSLLKHRRASVFSVKPVTQDGFGRFSLAALKHT
jgi:predicted O-methyltransferase YrrM